MAILENTVFMRFCCLKLSKKIEKLPNEQPTHAIAKCTLTGLVQWAKKSHQKCWLEFKMPLPPAKKQKTPACISEIQVHKLWTKVYSQKGLTVMSFHKVSSLQVKQSDFISLCSLQNMFQMTPMALQACLQVACEVVSDTTGTEEVLGSTGPMQDHHQR